MFKQSAIVFEQFGGIKELQRALIEVDKGRTLTALYRWNKPKGIRGTGGLIPSSALSDVLLAADHFGINLDLSLE